MSDIVISSFVSGIFGLITGIVVTWLSKSHSKPKGERLQKTKDGTIIIPTAFACASCNHEHVIQLHDEYKAEFNFSPSEFVDSIPDFASIVIRFPKAVNASKTRLLKFSLRFGKGKFNGILLEIHPDEPQKYGIWKMNIDRFSGWKEITVNLNEVEPRDIARTLKEICFVVTNSHFPDTSRLDGDFEVKGVTLID